MKDIKNEIDLLNKICNTKNLDNVYKLSQRSIIIISIIIDYFNIHGNDFIDKLYDRLQMIKDTKNIYYGEVSCSQYTSKGSKCTNKGYYIYKDKICCGVHSKKDDRKELKKNPDKKENTIKLLKQRQEL